MNKDIWYFIGQHEFEIFVLVIILGTITGLGLYDLIKYIIEKLR